MQSEISQPRYELITRHALALAGVSRAEIYLFDSRGGQLRRVAASFAPPVPADPTLPNPSPPDRTPPPILDDQHLASFADAVLERSSLHHRPPPAKTRHPGPKRTGEEHAPAANALHLVGSRIEAGNEVVGLVLFGLDHEPLIAGRRVLEDFVAEARRLTESRRAGRQTSSLEAARREEALLYLAEAALVGGDLETTLHAAVERLRSVLGADLVGLIR